MILAATAVLHLFLLLGDFTILTDESQLQGLSWSDCVSRRSSINKGHGPNTKSIYLNNYINLWQKSLKISLTF